MLTELQEIGSPISAQRSPKGAEAIAVEANSYNASNTRNPQANVRTSEYDTPIEPRLINPTSAKKSPTTLRKPGQQTIHRCTMRHPPLQDLMGTRKTCHRRPVLSKLSSSPLAWACGERFLLRRKLLGFSCLHLNEYLIFLSSTKVGV